jgi:hypothetical protein
VTSAEAFRSVLRGVVGPVLRDHGFKGSGSRWTKTSSRSDRAIVSIQRSPSSTRTETRFTVDLAIVPEQWVTWKRFLRPTSDRPTELDGLWRRRLSPGEGAAGVDEEVWTVHDEREATDAGRDLVAQLHRNGVPTLLRLLVRRELLAAVGVGDLGAGRGGFDRTDRDVALAVLLADEGEVGELEQVLRRLSRHVNEEGVPDLRLLAVWVAERLSVVTETGGGAACRS